MDATTPPQSAKPPAAVQASAIPSIPFAFFKDSFMTHLQLQ